MATIISWIKIWATQAYNKLFYTSQKKLDNFGQKLAVNLCKRTYENHNKYNEKLYKYQTELKVQQNIIIKNISILNQICLIFNMETAEI